MNRDARDTTQFKIARDHTAAWLRPGQGVPVDISDLSAAPDGQMLAGAATVCAELNGSASTRIALIPLESGTIRLATQGSGSERMPRWSPDGRAIAFLSDRARPHLHHLHLLDLASGEDRAATNLPGFVEYLQWSADGKSILLGIAGLGADLAAANGGFSMAKRDEKSPAWMADVDTGVHQEAWRSVWIYDVAADVARRASPEGLNIWEAVWCGADRIAAITSPAPSESEWYTADLRVIDLAGGTSQVLLEAQDQLGWLSASPSGASIAVVEAVCSDRTIVAGDLKVIDSRTGLAERIGTLGGDVVQTSWRSETDVLFTAIRGPGWLAGLADTTTKTSRPIQESNETTASGVRFPEAYPLGVGVDDIVFSREGFFHRPEIVTVREGVERTAFTFGDAHHHGRLCALGESRAVEWAAPDGLNIQGWLITPPGPGPHPLVLEIHGGPVWHYRPRYIARNAVMTMLVSKGYAILQVNPRGSSGRGQDFARRVFGDMGGADTFDYLSGLDAMIEQGVADPGRLGVTGGSYGGYMSSWLITQSDRFAAAVPLCPVTNWVSEHLTCHIPHFCEILLEDDIDNPASRYFSRSPIHFAGNVRTPTLHICGAMDKCTPPGQALEFHQALLMNGCTSQLVTYPQEGHGVRSMPTVFDYAARVVDWFETHMPANGAGR